MQTLFLFHRGLDFAAPDAGHVAVLGLGRNRLPGIRPAPYTYGRRGDDSLIISKQQGKMLSGPFWRQARPGQDSRRADLWLLSGVAEDSRSGVTAPEEPAKAAT